MNKRDIIFGLLSSMVLLTGCGSEDKQKSVQNVTAYTALGIYNYVTASGCDSAFKSFSNNQYVTTTKLIEYAKNTSNSCSDYGRENKAGECRSKSVGTGNGSCVIGYNMSTNTSSNSSTSSENSVAEGDEIQQIGDRVWEDSSSSYSYVTDYNSAKLYCENLSLAGYSNFRLPTKDELVDISTNYYDLFNNMSDFQYWTSEKYAGDVEQFQDYIIWVKMKNASDGFALPTSPISHVRCIESL